MSDAASPDTTTHIRTYARDVATLTGKPLPKKVVNVPAPQPEKPPTPPVTPVVKPATPSTPVPPPTPANRDEVLSRLRTNAFQQPTQPAESPVAPIHTYKSDFADRAKSTGASRISMVAAELDAGASTPQRFRPEDGSTRVAIIGGVLLIVAGIASIGGAYYFMQRSNFAVTPFSVPSLIYADEKIRIGGTSSELVAALIEAERTSLPDGGVAVTYLTYASTTKTGTVDIPADGGMLITSLGLPAPDLLLRNIKPESTVGVIRANEETRPFFILRVSSYERTFAGMLSWENAIADDLGLLFPAYPIESFGSTTPAQTPPRFTDLIVANRDVRALTDSSGRIILLYGYRDKETLVIARSREAFTELLSRLSAHKTP